MKTKKNQEGLILVFPDTICRDTGLRLSNLNTAVHDRDTPGAIEVNPFYRLRSKKDYDDDERFKRRAILKDFRE